VVRNNVDGHKGLNKVKGHGGKRRDRYTIAGSLCVCVCVGFEGTKLKEPKFLKVLACLSGSVLNL